MEALRFALIRRARLGRWKCSMHRPREIAGLQQSGAKQVIRIKPPELTRIWRDCRLTVARRGPHRRATVAGQGWLAGPKPSLDAVRWLASTFPSCKRLVPRSSRRTWPWQLGPNDWRLQAI